MLTPSVVSASLVPIQSVGLHLPKDAGKLYPKCVAGAGACPPEDCGGTTGFAELLEVLADPEHDEHESMLEWVGGGFDAEHCDLAAVNESLSFIADRRQR